MSARERLAAALDGFSEFDWASLGTDELVSRMFADDPDLESAIEIGLAWQEAVAALPEGWAITVVTAFDGSGDCLVSAMNRRSDLRLTEGLRDEDGAQIAEGTGRTGLTSALQSLTTRLRERSA